MEKHRVRRNDQKKKMVIIAVLSVIVIISFIAASLTGFKPKGTAPQVNEDLTPQGNIVVDENQEDSAQTEEAVNALIRQYRAALACANIETISQLYHTDKVANADTITATSRVITGYMNTKCYIRSGLEEGTKVVFIYDELQIADVDVLVPNLSYVYVRKAADGTYFIDPGTYNEETMSYEYDKNITNYVNELSGDAQISGLYESVNSRFEQICKDNQKLSAFMQKINDSAALHSSPDSGMTTTDTTDAVQSAQTVESDSTSLNETGSTDGAA